MRNSLVAQWLGLSAFTVVAQVQSLGGKLRSRKLLCAAKKKKKEGKGKRKSSN